MNNDKEEDVKIRPYKIFLEGELVNLTIPSEDAINLDGWADWFNDIPRLSNTGHGIFPNFPENQHKILEEIRRGNKLVLLISEKLRNRAFGVISLQNIDFVGKSAEIAIVIGNPKIAPASSYSFVEAMALIAQHGFEVMGLDRIYAGQSYPSLSGWNKLLELIGFKTEGITRRSFRRGHNVSDTVLIACMYEDFLKLKEIRGSLWGSKDKIKKLIKLQPKRSFAQIFDEAICSMEKEYFEYLFVKLD